MVRSGGFVSLLTNGYDWAGKIRFQENFVRSGRGLSR